MYYYADLSQDSTAISDGSTAQHQDNPQETPNIDPVARQPDLHSCAASRESTASGSTRKNTQVAGDAQDQPQDIPHAPALEMMETVFVGNEYTRRLKWNAVCVQIS